MESIPRRAPAQTPAASNTWLRSLDFGEVGLDVGQSRYEWVDGWRAPEEIEFLPPVRTMVEIRDLTNDQEVSSVARSPRLHRQLAALPATEAATADFAQKFGTLGPHRSRLPIYNADRRWNAGGELLRVQRETLDDWRAEIERLALLIDTWDAANDPEDDRVAQYVHRYIDDDSLVCWPLATDEERQQRHPMQHVYGGFGSRLDDRGRRSLVARDSVASEVANDLTRLTQLRIGQEGFSLYPRSMLGVAYSAFAAEITAGARRGQLCLICGQPLTDAQRRTRQFCSERCRSQSKRDRRKTEAANAVREDERLMSHA